MKIHISLAKVPQRGIIKYGLFPFRNFPSSKARFLWFSTIFRRAEMKEKENGFYFPFSITVEFIVLSHVDFMLVGKKQHRKPHQLIQCRFY
jgi:hypothetical protein